MPDQYQIAAIELLKQMMSTDVVRQFPICSAFSMAPFFRNTDVLILKRVEVRDIQVGDILVIQQSEGMYAHRCVKLFPRIATKGDNLKLGDRHQVTEENLIGRVIGVRCGDRVYSCETPLYRKLSRAVALISEAQAAILSWSRGAGAPLVFEKLVFALYRQLLLALKVTLFRAG